MKLSDTDMEKNIVLLKNWNRIQKILTLLSDILME